MSMSPASDIKDAILEQIAGYAFARNLFVSEMPESPDDCICIYDSGGFAPEAGFESNYKYERPTVQVIVRGAVGKYLEAYSKASVIKNTLHNAHEQSWGVSRYIGIWAMSDILSIGPDEKNRPKLSVNFVIHRTD